MFCFLKLKKLKFKIITILMEFLSSCFVELSNHTVKASVSDLVFNMFIVKCIHFLFLV